MPMSNGKLGREGRAGSKLTLSFSINQPSVELGGQRIMVETPARHS